MSISGNARQWRVRPSRLACDTINPMRLIIENINIQPNSEKTFIHLSVGDPTHFGNLKPPDEVFDAVRESLTLNASRGYKSLAGDYEARKAIAEYSKLQGDVSPDDVIICNGCSHAIDLVQSTLVEAGQNIIVPRPGYSIHETLGKGLGVKIKHYNLLPEDNWKVDLKSLEQAIDENTGAIVVNNPSNPCGSVYDKEHLKEILAIASKHYVPIIADEIYENFVFAGQEYVHISALSTDVPILTCSGISKRFLVPGWRLGWIIIHDRNNILGKPFRQALQNMTSRILGSNALIQHALPKILKCVTHNYFNDMMIFIENQARLFCRELQKAPGLYPVMPQGSLYMMVRIKMSQFPTIQDEFQFTKKLCDEQLVLCMPGSCFNSPGYMRLILTVPEEVLLKACSRIVMFCRKYASLNTDPINVNTAKSLLTVNGCGTKWRSDDEVKQELM